MSSSSQPLRITDAFAGFPLWFWLLTGAMLVNGMLYWVFGPEGALDIVNAIFALTHGGPDGQARPVPAIEEFRRSFPGSQSIALHYFAMPLVLVAGAAQFSQPVREKAPRLHRATGWVMVTATLLGVSGALYRTFAGQLYGGMLSQLQFAGMGAMVLVCLSMGVVSARRRDFRVHERWMLRTYLVLWSSAVVSRLGLLLWVPLLWQIMGQRPEDYGVPYNAILFFSWAFPVVAADIILDRPHRAATSFETAGVDVSAPKHDAMLPETRGLSFHVQRRGRSYDPWVKSQQHLSFRGFRIAYWSQNKAGPEADTLFLIHGFPTASWDWHRVWDALGRRFRLVALDMLGYGLSDKPRNHTYSIFEQADIHEALAESMGITRCHILAHNYGDTVAQELLARHHRRSGDEGLRLQSVCFLNGGLFPESHRPVFTQKMLLSPLGPWVARLMNKRRFESRFAAVFGRRTQPTLVELDDLWTLVAAHGGTHRVAHRLIRYIPERKAHRERWVQALIESTVPLRLINSLDDPVSGGHLADRYQALVPQADVVRLSDVGHYPQLEAPSLVLAAYEAFAERVAQRPETAASAAL